MKIIVDTDPGADDCMALLMLLVNPSITDVIAVTTVAGNADIDTVTRNTIRTLELANRIDIPVYKGASQGLVYEAKNTFFFGVDGFGESTFSTPLPEDVLKEGVVAANYLVNQVKAMPDGITILAIGPLTNIALAIALCPNFLHLVKHLIIFGGSLGEGNIYPGTEFNFNADPEAAQLVLSKSPEDKPILLVPLETVREVAFSMNWRLNVFGKLTSKYVKFINQVERLSLAKRDVWAPYDPVAAAILIDPSIIVKVKMVAIKVLCCPEFARGAMIVDYNSDSKNVQLVTEVNKDVLKNLLLFCFDRIDI